MVNKKLQLQMRVFSKIHRKVAIPLQSIGVHCINVFVYIEFVAFLNREILTFTSTALGEAKNSV